ncbi:MAG: arginase family protein, partial [Cyclobacteriaceae bacterium]
MSDEFNPSGVSRRGLLFGLPYYKEDAELVLIPVPWEVTTSYRAGTSKGANAILEASNQVDLSLKAVFEPWNFKVAMQDVSSEIKNKSKKLKKKARRIIDHLEQKGSDLPPELLSVQQEINQACEDLNDQIYLNAKKLIAEGKIPAVLGGEHSSPLGLIRALSEHHEFGILQIDAHMDLR